MRLDEYLGNAQQKRKILVVSNLSRGNALIRNFEKETAGVITNVECRTLLQIAKELYAYYMSENGFTGGKKLINNEEAVILFRSLLLENIETGNSQLTYFTNKEIMSLTTIRHIFGMINIVRCNGWTDKADGINEPRISDMKKLISLYENKMDELGLFDMKMLYEYLLDRLPESNEDEYIKYIFSAEIAFLDEETDRYTGIEKRFLQQLQLCINEKECRICLYDDANMLADSSRLQHEACVAHLKGKAQFYRGYGAYNEANYICYDILKNNYAYGDVKIYYSSKAQIPAIEAAIKGNGLKAAFLSPRLMQDNIYCDLAQRILEWAKDDFSETALEYVFSSKAIAVKYGKESKNALRDGGYFNYVIDARNRRTDDRFILGWGFERNKQFIENEKKAMATKCTNVSDEDNLTETDENIIKNIEIINMHEKMLNIFCDKDGNYSEKDMTLNPVDMFERLIRFIEDYHYSGGNKAEYINGISGLRNKLSDIKYNYFEMSPDRATEFISEIISEITYTDEDDSSSISIQCLNGWHITERQYVYMIGLSLMDIQGDNTESPILSDNELDSYIGEGFKPTAATEAELRDRNVYRTLKLYNGEKITFGYSAYDTVRFCENNPSTIYRNIYRYLSSNDDIKKITEFVYGNPDKQYDTNIQRQEGDSSTPAIERINYLTSNSIVENYLLDCPKKYAYSKVLHIPEEEKIIKDSGKWLDAKQKGTFFHELAKRYVDDMFVSRRKDEYLKNIDESLISKLVDEIKNNMLTFIPVSILDIANKEADNIKAYSCDYFISLHKRLYEGENNIKWIPVLTEQRFEDSEFKIKSFQDNEYSFKYNGIIDRIDYSLNEANKTVSLRIIDYKTGRKATKEKEFRLGKVIQHSFYKEALMNSGKVGADGDEKNLLNFVKEIINIRESGRTAAWEYKYDGFIYEFPISQDYLEISDGDCTNITRLKTIVSIIEERNIFPDHEELFKLVEVMLNNSGDDDLRDFYSKLQKKTKGEGNGELSPDEISGCKYCSYSNICRAGKVGAV